MTAIRASERSAYNICRSRCSLKELIAIVGRALSEPKERTRQPAKPTISNPFRWWPLAGDAEMTVMISGKSPAPGKELVARAITASGGPGRSSPSTWPFRACDEVGYFSGTRRGPSPGAKVAAPGRFGEDTLLDEIGDMPMEAQAACSTCVRELGGHAATTRICGSCAGLVPAANVGAAAAAAQYIPDL